MKRLFAFLLLWCIPLQLAAATPEKPVSLSDAVDALIKKYKLPPKGLSIDFVSLKDGSHLYQYHADRPLNPASTMKVLTTVAAFETLGAEHRYPTEFYTSSLNNPSELPDLWVKGYGNPFLVREEMQWIAKSLKRRGIQRINGPIFVDDTYFGAAEPIRFAGTTGKSLYRVVTGALSYNFNRPEILVSQARRYRQRYPTVSLASGAAGRTALLNRKVLDPAIYTGLTLKKILAKQGIQVTGDVRFRPLDPTAVLLLHHASPPLTVILKSLNKESNNFIAEQILRSLAATRYGIASREQGLTVLEATLDLAGSQAIPFTLNNASGLSRENRLSALHLTSLLQHAIKAPYAMPFMEALSIAGVDGTLRRRFRESPLRGKLWAKTGSLYQVNALAGYTVAGEEAIAFCILINDYTTNLHRVQKAAEKIIELVVNSVTKGEVS